MYHTFPLFYISFVFVIFKLVWNSHLGNKISIETNVYQYNIIETFFVPQLALPTVTAYLIHTLALPAVTAYLIHTLSSVIF